jgi:preprotein translocase subunit SecA
MDYLREGIGLRAYSQRDPLVEYQREGFDMFAAMMDGIKEESVGYLFNLEVQVQADDDAGDATEVETGPALSQAAAAAHGAPAISAKGLDSPKRPEGLAYSAPSETGAAEVRGTAADAADDIFTGVSRNADCPCGSGKKYKKCHGAPGGPTGLTTRVNG